MGITIGGGGAQVQKKAQEEVLVLLAGEAAQPVLTLEFLELVIVDIRTKAVSSVELPLPEVTGNAVVEKLPVRIQAKRADLAPLNLFSTRASWSVNASARQVTVVVDFGTPMTVTAVLVDNSQTDNKPLRVFRVTPWTGTAFANSPMYPPGSAVWSDPGPGVTVLASQVTFAAPSHAAAAVLRSEVRTERLKIELIYEGSEPGKVPARLAVQLPDAPADLELRLGTTVVWRQAGPFSSGGTGAQAAAAAAVDVDLAEALKPLTGDPARTDPLGLPLVLTSRVPGNLSLTLQDGKIRYLVRPSLGPEEKIDLLFDAEGQKTAALTVPAPYTRLHGVGFRAVGKPTPERILPPVGPTAATEGTLVLDAWLAACAHLPSGDGLSTLLGVRIPLQAEEGGAEARVVLLQDKDGQPGDPLPGGASLPQTLEAGALSSADGFVTFTFAQPVPLGTGARPWAAVVLSRGRALWSFAATSTAPIPLRSGPPSGPWGSLPTLFQVNSQFNGLGGRLRVVGLPAEETPISPFTVRVSGTSAGDGIPVTPTPKGVRIDPPPWSSPVTLSGPSGGGTVTLSVLGRNPTSLSLSEIDLLVSKPSN